MVFSKTDPRVSQTVVRRVIDGDRQASSAVGSLARLPSGAVAFVPASSMSSVRSRDVIDALRSENEFLANQLLDARRALRECEAERDALLAERQEARALAPASALSPLQFGRMLETVQRGERAHAAVAPAEGGHGASHHYHAPVHFHFHGLEPQPRPGAPGAARPPSGAAAVGGARRLLVGPISCANLRNRDAKGRSDPYVRIRSASASASVESARQDNTLDPSWPGTLALGLRAEEAAAPVVVEVWDWDNKGPEPLGHVELDLRARPRGGPETFSLSGGAEQTGGRATITLSWRLDGEVAEPDTPAAGGERAARVPAGGIRQQAVVAPLPSALGVPRTLVLGPIRCEQLKNRDAKGRSDPFVRARAAAAGGAVVESARKDNTLSPAWEEPLRLGLREGDDVVLVELWDWDTTGAESLGAVELNVRERPGGGPERFALRGNAQEVGPHSAVTLTWAVAQAAAEQ